VLFIHTARGSHFFAVLKTESARIFFDVWKKAEAAPSSAEQKKAWKTQMG
jgi:hypothetical protein